MGLGGLLPACSVKTNVAKPDESLEMIAQTEKDPQNESVGPEFDRNYLEFAENWMERARIGQSNLLQELIAWDEIDRRATDAIECPAYLKQEFLQRLDAVRKGPEGFAAGVANTVGSGGDYQFLRFRDLGGKVHALFRTAKPNQHVDYHDLELMKKEDGTVVVADIRVLRHGLALSEIFRDAFLEFLVDKDASLVHQFVERDKDYILDRTSLRLMAEHLDAGRSAEVLAEYSKLRPSVQATRKAMLQRLIASIAVSETEGNKAIEDYRRLYPNSETAALVAATLWFDKGQSSQALEAIDRFEESFGPDPYLHVFRSRCHLASGVVYKAREEANLAVEAMPDLIDGYEAKLAIAMRDRDYRYAAEVLEQMAIQFHGNPETLANRKELSEFRKSRAYKDCLARWEQRQKGSAPAKEDK